MKKVFFKFLFLFALVSVFVFSCSDSSSTGMGKAVDTEPPEITITSPEYFSYVSRTFTVTGTCHDNAGIDYVEVVCTYQVPQLDENGNKVLNENGAIVMEKKSISKKATRKGDSWTCELTIDADGDISVTATAWDDRKNEGVDFQAAVTVIIDTNPPVITDVNVKRNGQYQVNLATKKTLDSKSEIKTSDKDYFQNEEFTITAKINENNNIDYSYLSLFDEDGTLLIEKQYPDGCENYSEGSSEFNEAVATSFPEWTIKGADLIKIGKEKGINYETGKHYLFPKITTADKATNSVSRAIMGEIEVVKHVWEGQPVAYSNDEDAAKYLCWWPETDVPKASYPLYSGDGINVQKNTLIPVNIFDDDGLGTIYYGLVDKSTETALGESAVDFAAYFTAHPEILVKVDMADGEPDGVPGKIYELDMSNLSSIARDLNLAKLDSGIEAKTYTLVVGIKDKKILEGYDTNWKYSTSKVYVDSKDAPIIIIESPQENTSAALENNKFKIKGFTLDDKNVKKMAIAWLPEGNDQIDSAKAALNEFDFSGNKTTEDGIKIYNISPSAGDGSAYKKALDEFEKEFNVLSDFTDKNGNVINDNKLFLIYVVDTEENIVSKTFRLGSYTADPTFELFYSEDNIHWIEFSDTLIQVEGKIYFKVRPVGANGLEIDDGTFEGELAPSNLPTPIKIDLSSPDSDGYCYFDSDPIAGGRIDLTFNVKDKLGNPATQKNTVTFGESPTLQSITTGVRDGIILIKDDVLTLQANFSMNVTVGSGTAPYIELSGIKINNADPAEVQKAVYKSGSGTDTLIFEYVVPSGAKSEKVETPTANPITDSAKRILATITGSFGSISAKKIVQIDAVPPKLDIDHCVPAKNAIIHGNTIKVAFDEEIEAESGTITVQRTAGWAIPPVLDDETFKAIYNSVGSDDKITLIGTDTGEPELLENAGTPKGPYKKITHGLDLSGTDAVPDTDTKYVLAFDYEGVALDIFATTGKVAEIREVLENYGYHKKEFDLSECEVNGKFLEITLPDDWFVDGRQFEVLIPEGCVRDDAGNTNDEIVSGTYTFWTNKVATPVIRVDRYTHGAGISEPNEDGTLVSIIDSKAAFETEPTGYARVKIDCETPGAAIKYKLETKTSDSVATNPPAAAGDGKTENIPLADATTAEVIALTPSENYSGIFTVGSDDFETSNKYYIKAEATFATATAEQPAMAKSDAGYEGAYRTVFLNRNPNRAGSATSPILLQGSCSQGEPLIAGFPMRDANPDERYGRTMYQKVDGSNTDYIVISFDIVSTFRCQTFKGNWSKNEDTNCSYGWVIYNNEREYHN